MEDYYNKDDETAAKLIELQENIQKLQLLKQIGAKKLILRQEREIFKIQEQLRRIDGEIPLELLDILPRKCQFCTDYASDDDRLTCFESSYKECKKKDIPQIGSIETGFLKILLLFGMLIITLLCFMLISNILFKFLEERLVVFLITLGIVSIIVLVFLKPVMRMYRLFT
jgi:hypothetical protein